MIEVIDFSSWNEYEGTAEGSGRSEKIWLKSLDGRIGLFKFPKIDPMDGVETTEHISEHLAYKIGMILGVQTAKVDIGIYKGRIGSMSYFICEEKEFLSEGIWFIAAKYPQYNAELMQDEQDKRYYCLEHLANAVPNNFSNKAWIEMLVFDYLIGNSDRHQSNWALLIKVLFEKSIRVEMRWCPLYDNGSSLCCYVNSEQLSKLLGNDKNRFEALVDSKSRSRIRIDGYKKNLPSHREVVAYLLKKYPETKEICKNFLERLTKEKLNVLLEEYSIEILTQQKKELILRFLYRKLEILNELLKEAENSDANE